MKLSELTFELVARGADDNETRNTRWINMAYRLIIDAYDWPFAIIDNTGTADAGTVTVGSNFRKVLLVADKNFGNPGRPLKRISFEELSEQLHVRDVTITGVPEYWYYDAPSSTIRTFPSGGTVYVRYLTRLDELANPDDTPLFDDAYQLMIVDRAMIEVHMDNDNVASAQALQAKYAGDLQKMAMDYGVLSRTHTYVDVGEPYDG